MKTIIKITIGIILAFVLLAVGLSVLIGGAVNQTDKDIKKGQAEHAITKSEFKSLTQGMSVDSVVESLGDPADKQVMNAKQLKTTYLYYNVHGGEFGDQYQITFTNGKLDGKNSY